LSYNTGYHAVSHGLNRSSILIGGSKKKKEDTFGQNDADWEVYKEIVSDILSNIFICIYKYEKCL
jgi:hypothetical protein